MNNNTILRLNKAAFGFSDIIMVQSMDIKLQYIDRLVECIKTNKRSYLAIKILQGILKKTFEDKVGSGNQHPEIENLSDMIDYLEKKHNLYEAVFANLACYMRAVKAELQKDRPDLKKESEWHTSSIVDDFMHSDQISERLQFIMYFAKNSSKVKMNAGHLQTLWKELVQDSPIEKDRKLIYDWLRDLCDSFMKAKDDPTKSNAASIVNLNDLMEFFQKSILNSSDNETLLSDLSQEGFHCIQSFFIMLNLMSGKIDRLTDEGAMYDGKHLEAETKPDAGWAAPSVTGGEVAVQKNDITDGAGNKPDKKFTSFNNQTGAAYSSYSFTKSKSDGPQEKMNAANDGPSTPKAQIKSGVTTGTQIGPQLPATKTSTNNAKAIDPEDINIEVMVPPNELDGYDVIWRIATESTGKQVIDGAVKLLVQMHQDLSAEMRGRLVEFDELFIDKCFSFIEDNLPTINSRTKEQFEAASEAVKKLPGTATQIMLLKAMPIQERKVMRALFLLKQMIRAADKNGTFDLKPHIALQQGTLLPSLQISNNLTMASTKPYRQRFDLAASNSMTLWELKKFVAKECLKTTKDGGATYRIYPEAETGLPPPSIHPGSISLYILSGSRDIKDSRNGDTLKEITIGKNEQLSFKRKSAFLTRKVPILVDDDKTGEAVFTFRAQQVISEIFKMFSEEREGLGRVMTVMHCADYTAACTASVSSDADPRVVSFVDKYAFQNGKFDKSGEPQEQDENVEKLVDVSGLEAFCRDSILTGKEDKLRQNWKKLGYANDLSRLPEDGEDENILQLRGCKENMPRYKVATRKYFDRLMTLMDLRQDIFGQISLRAGEVINTLVTQPDILESVKNLAEGFKWETIFGEGTGVHSILYSLEIIVTILVSEQPIEDLTNWVKRFIDLGGLEQLQNLLDNALGSPQVDSEEEGSAQKKLVDKLLKVLRMFVMTALNPVEKVPEPEEPKEETKDEPKAEQKPAEKKQVTFQQDSFKTPVKNNSSGQIQPKVSSFDPQIGDITEETLFDETAVGDDAKEGTTNMEDQIDTSGKAAAPADKKDDAKQEEDPTDLLGNMRQVMNDKKLAQMVLGKIDLGRLQHHVIKLVHLILSKEDKASLKRESIQIVESSMELWSSLVTNADTENDFQINPEFLIQGLLLTKEIKIRESFFNTFKELAKSSVKQCSDIFNIIAGYFEQLSRDHADETVKHSRSKEFFNLLRALMEVTLQRRRDQVEGSDYKPLLSLMKTCIDQLKQHKSSEKSNSILVDYVLQGYMLVIQAMLAQAHSELPKKREENEEHTDFYTDVMKVLDESQFIDFLFKKGLFSHELIDGVMQLSKCLATETRKVAFGVLDFYQRCLRPKELTEYLQQNLVPLMEVAKRPKKWKFKPSNDGKNHGFCGITNLGCICYMISMLQQTFMVPQFRYQLLKAEDNTPEDLKLYKGDMIDDNLLRQLQKMFGFLECSEKAAFNPKEFCFAFKDFFGEPTPIGEQKDSQEFVQLFFDRMEQVLVNTTQKNLVQDIFRFSQCSQLKCPECGKISSRLETYYSLTCQVKGFTNLEESIANNIAGTDIEGYRCSFCNKSVNIRKSALLGEMPNTLIVHLQRIEFNFSLGELDKINSYLEFPQHLDLAKYSYKEQMKDSDDIAHPELMEVADDDYIYRLVGVNIHTGTATGGHYYSHINTKRGDLEPDATLGEKEFEEWKKSKEDPWKTFNDDKVSSFTWTSLKNEAYGQEAAKAGAVAASDAMTEAQFQAFLAGTSTGGASKTYGKSAYLLIYERKSKKNLREYHVQEGSEEKKEVEIDFRSVKKYVPQQIEQVCLADNKQFLVDSTMFSDTFFDFVKSTYKYINSDLTMTQHQYPHSYAVNFEVMKKICVDTAGQLLFDMLAHYDHNVMMSDVASQIQTIITFADSQYRVVDGEPSVVAAFVDKYILKEREHFLDLMFGCTDVVSRKHGAAVAAHAVTRLFKLYARIKPEDREVPTVKEIKRVIDEFYDMVFHSLQSRDCCKNWSRLESFFGMIKDCVSTQVSQSQLILERDGDVIADMIDFVLGNSSPRMAGVMEKRPNMGGTVVAAPFSNIFTSICFLIRQTHTPQMKLDERYSTHVHFEKFEGDFETHKTYELGEEANLMLENTDFLDKPMYDAKYTDNVEYGKCLAHLSYKNLPFSKRMIAKLLKCIAYSTDADAIDRLLKIVKELTLLKDEFQEQRLEYMFGFPFFTGAKNTVDNSDLIQYGAITQDLTKSEENFLIGSALDSQLVEKSLLAALSKSKNRMDGFTLNSLRFLTNLITEDDTVGRYFAGLPAATYNERRYTDWIKSYLLGKLADNAKFASAIGAKQKEEQILEVMSKAELYEEKLLTNFGDCGLGIQYAVLRATSQKEIKREMIADGKLELVIHQVACEWVESDPTGVANKSIDKERLDKIFARDFAAEKCRQEGIELEDAPQEEIPDLAISDDMLYRFSIDNKTGDHVEIEFCFNIAEGKQTNLEVPKSHLKDYIKAGLDGATPIITLRKVIADQASSFENLEFKLLNCNSTNDSSFTMSSFGMRASNTSSYPAGGTAVNIPTSNEASKNINSQRRNGIQGVSIKLNPTTTGADFACDPDTAMAIEGNVASFVAGDVKATQDGATSPASTGTAPAKDYSEQLQQIKEMGFTDEAVILSILESNGGNVERTLNTLFS